MKPSYKICGFVQFLFCLLTFLVLLPLAILPVSAQALKETAPEPQYVNIQVKGVGAFGSSVDMVAEVFKPTGSGPFPVLIYSHGRSATQAERSAITEAIPREYMQYWLSKGFAVVAPMRPGYGKTGGADREAPGHSWDSAGRCTGRPDFERTINAASVAPLAVLDWLRQQPWANTSAVVLSGNSVGGVTTVALGANNPAGVVGYINFAGGIAGNPSRSPGKSCDPDRLLSLLSAYGKRTKVPNLWIYAENDLFWGAEVPKAWHVAFAEGGSPTTFNMTRPLPSHDGHDLIFFGRTQWIEPVDAFLKRIGLQ